MMTQSSGLKPSSSPASSIISRPAIKNKKNIDETFLFLFLPSVQRDLFLNYLDGVESTTLRDVFDAYMCANTQLMP